MVIYADASFLFSFYAQDANSDPAYEWMQENDTPLCLTHFQRHELRNAVRLTMFRGTRTLDQCSRILENIEEDIRIGTLVFTKTNWDDTYARAEMLSQSSTATTGCRGADILHIAIAQTLAADVFLTFDTRQRALAKIAGLETPL